jgi:hypothetical protein
MGLLDGPLKGVAQSLIKTLGSQIVMVQVLPGKFLSAQNKAVLSEVRHTVAAVIAENKSQNHKGDQKFMVPAADLGDLIPSTDWYLEWNGVRYDIDEVMTQYASAVPVSFDIYATAPVR